MKTLFQSKNTLRQPLTRIAIAVAALALSACATMETEALNNNEVAATVRADKQLIAKDVEPLNGSLTLEEAIARSIKYNAERRLRAMEEAVAYGTFEAGSFDMLPKLVASAGYRDRSNDYITRSKDSVTGQPSLAHPFISSSRQAITTDLGFSWSLLDFGQSYFAAKQNADRVLVAQERRRKALHNLVQDVRTAFWRVVAAQTLSASVRATINDAEGVLRDAQSAEQERLRNPLEPLRFQRQILENLKLLETVEQELSTARIELAALTNLPLSQDFKVIDPGVGLSKAWLDIPVAELEEHALLQNADLREGMYNSRIARQETRRALLRLFPGLSFNYGTKTSDDPYLINQRWNEVGAQVSFNLLGLLAIPSQMRLADAGIALADQKRMVTQLAVLTQVHIARLQYANSLRQYERTESIANVETRISEHVSNQAIADKQTKLDRISQQTSMILAQLRRYQALSNTQGAASKLQATLGLEPVVNSSNNESLQNLTEAVGVSLKAWGLGKLPKVEVTEETGQQE